MERTLSLFSGVLDDPIFLRDLSAGQWRRSIRAQGGSWLGSLRLEGMDAGSLQQLFLTILGYHLEERVAGVVTWSGMVYEVDLVHQGDRQRRSLDMVANAVKTTYKTLAYEGDNQVPNYSFEIAGSGDPDFFASWVEGVGASPGAIADETTSVHSGSHAAWIMSCGTTDTNGNPNTYVRRNLNLTAGTSYQMTFWTRGYSGVAGRYAIRDPNTPAWIVSPRTTGVTGNTYTQVTRTFTAPSEGEVLIYFYAGPTASDVAYFDDVEVREEIEVVHETSYVTQAQSISQYGRREAAIDMERYPLAAAEARRDVYLAENAWPWPRPVSLGQGEGTALELMVAGYVFTANWMQREAGDDAEHDVDEAITDLVGTTTGLTSDHGGSVWGAGDCQFLAAGDMASNTLQVLEDTERATAVWDLIGEWVQLGDASGNHYRVWVDAARKVHYQQLDITPRYYLRDGALFETPTGGVTVSPWRVQSGVVRNMGLAQGSTEPGSFLGDSRDRYVEEVEMADGWPAPMLKTALLTESEILAAQYEAAGPGSELPAGESAPANENRAGRIIR